MFQYIQALPSARMKLEECRRVTTLLTADTADTPEHKSFLMLQTLLYYTSLGLMSGHTEIHWLQVSGLLM